MTLNDLLSNINSKTTGNALDFIPGALPSGLFTDFFKSLTSGDNVGISIQLAKPVEEEKDGGKLNKISIEGDANFIGVDTHLLIHFTEDDKGLIAEGNIAGNAPWHPIQWFGFSDLTIPFKIHETEGFLSGDIESNLTLGSNITLKIPLPIVEKKWTFSGQFNTNPPSLNTLFQLAGGINLIRSLPGSLSTISGFGLRELEILYDGGIKKLAYITFQMQTDQRFALIPALNLDLDEIKWKATVNNPSDTAQRELEHQIDASFKIQNAIVNVNVENPGFKLKGALDKDHGSIKIADFIQSFSLPAFDVDAAVTDLQFSYDPALTDYAFDLEIGTPLVLDPFSVNQVKFSLSGRKAGDKLFQVFGSTTILDNINLALSAIYQKVNNKSFWLFQGRTTINDIHVSKFFDKYLGWENIDPNVDFPIKELGFSVQTDTKAFEFSAQAEWASPLEDNVNLAGTALLGSAGNNSGYYGTISAEIQWRNIDLLVFYNFDPKVKQFGIRWWKLEGILDIKSLPNGQKQKTATLAFTESTTLGEMIETMIGWATGSNFGLSAPWDLLNKITLDDLSLTYDFTAGKVSFNVAIGPIDLGFARITSIGVAYNSDKDKPENNGVLIDLQGSFFWQTDNPQKPLSWDASRPETTPAPPGGGNKYLDLRLLALGQHVTLPCFATADSVQKAIECMVDMPDPEPGQLPTITFDPKSNWLIGADFGILKLDEETTTDGGVKRVKQNYFLSLQIVFNDPHLYGLRLALEGKPAKIFAGLDFQVMYRQISDSVGVYQTEIQLPDIMRRITVGAYTITLPVFAIAIYTNGDFQIDLGFPWNHDFTRSFAVEAIIPPGIPVVGAAGLYFGKLSSGTTNKVPAAINGTFNPVIVFGFGAQIGVGKSFEAGIFRAGLSLTIVGIIEGVLAKWNPYQLAAGQGTSTQVQGEYYFWLQGTFGIIGRLYGSIDFAIVRADVNITLAIFAQITFATYEPIVFSVMASVDVSVKVRINLGLFKITLHFSFSMTVKQTFTLDNSGTPPWQVASGGTGTRGILLAPTARRLATARSLTFTERTLVSDFRMPKWDNFQPVGAARIKLDGYLAMGLTIAKDEYTDSEEQQVCGIISLFLDSVAPDQPSKGESSFEKLAKHIFRWVIAATQTQSLTFEDVDALVITDGVLESIQNYLSNTQDTPEPIPNEAIEQFLRLQVELLIHDTSSTAAEISGAFFPLPLHLTMTIPDYGDWKGVQYNFGTYNTIAPEFLDDLRTHFDELAVQATTPLPPEEPIVLGRGLSDIPKSVASYLRSDYFLLIARQMVQAARRSLRNLKYPLNGKEPIGAIVETVNGNAELNGEFTRYDLFAANAHHLLNPSRKIRIGTSVHYIVNMRDSIEAIAKMDFDINVNTLDIVLANADKTDILQPGKKVTDGKHLYTTTGKESIRSIAEHFGLSLTQFLKVTKFTDFQVYLMPNVALDIPLLVRYNLQEGDAFDSIAKTTYENALTAQQLATRNQYYPILKTGTELSISGKTYIIVEGDNLSNIAAKEGIKLEDLLSKTTVKSKSGNTQPILSSTELLNPSESLLVPPFDYTTKSEDTIESVVARFDINIHLLADAPENDSITDLFASSDPYLNIPHLGQYRVSEILADIQRTDGLKNLSGMTSRYYLHGLRLPTSGIQSLKKGLWVRQVDGNLVLPSESGIYALTGQQFALPPRFTNQPLVISFVLQGAIQGAPGLGGGKWARFDSEASPLKWDIKIDPNATEGYANQDFQRIKALQDFLPTAKLNLALSHLGMEKPYQTIPTSYSLASPASWNNASPIPLPYGNEPDGATVLKLWRLPEAMLNVPDRSKHLVDPRFKMVLGQYDEATGNMNERAIGYYGWGTAIDFTIKKLQDTSESATGKTTYEIVGAGTKEIVLLERLFKHPNRDDKGLFQQLIIGFAGDQEKGGIQTDTQSSTTMGIAKVNLSTVTNPPPQQQNLFIRSRSLETPPKATLLNKNEIDFLKLLWEASITRSGGFYLYYYNTDTKTGLPNRIFNDKGEAKVTLIALYQQPTNEAAQHQVTGFMNAAITGESINIANSSVYAKADIWQESIPKASLKNITLSDLAEQYFANIGDIALANAFVTLRPGVSITIKNAVFLVKPNGIVPGRRYKDIAAYLEVSEKALILLNKDLGSVGVNSDLPIYTMLRVPDTTITINNNDTSFSYLANKYNVSIAGLAFDNANIKDLYDHDIIVPSGPSIRSATIAVDQLALEARSSIPADVPDDPNDELFRSSFADTLLRNNYHLMRFCIAENLDFKQTVFGLPIGPATIPDPDNPGESAEATNNIWEYKTLVPYTRFLKAGSDTGVGGLPDQNNSPYRGINKVLQPHFEWLDIYGNRMRTTLSDPGEEAFPEGIFNQPPLLTGYNDALIGLGQWPSVSSNWRVLPNTHYPNADFQITIQLQFESSRYRGLLLAMAPDPKTVQIFFSEPINQQEAKDPEKYDLGTEVQIDSIDVQPDGKSVTLHVNDLPSGFDFLLIVKQIPWASDGICPNSEALFHYPDEPKRRTTSLTKQAARELKVYETLWHQINDPHGVAFNVNTTLLENPIITLSDNQKKSLINDWLSGIYHFVNDRAQGQAQVAVPRSTYFIELPLKRDLLRKAQIFKLELNFEVQRLSNFIMGDFTTTPAVKQVSTQILPATDNKNLATRGLTDFATDFERATSQDQVYQLKIATGVDRFELSTSRSGGKIWVVRLGLSKGASNSILYRINNTNKPLLFAPRPISNKLESDQVVITKYETGRGLTEAEPNASDFVNIDMDVWGRQFLEAIDYVLTPRFIAAIQLIDLKNGNTYLSDLLSAKENLANLVQNWMIPVFQANAGANPAEAREAFRQRLLMRLSNAYSTYASVQFDTTVQADIHEELEIKEAPKLYGTIEFDNTNANATVKSNVTLSASKLTLNPSPSQPLNFLVSAPGLVKGADGEVLSSVELNLKYQGTAIEHQIGTLTNEEPAFAPGYKASSWLTFVVPGTVMPLTASLGDFKVPLVLRSYPDSPEMMKQLQETAPFLTSQLNKVKLWDYHFIYSRNFHYPQDRLHCEVEFNINEAEKRGLDLQNAFAQLAQFVTVYPAVKADFESNLSKISTDTTTDSAEFKTANAALNAFNAMVQAVIDASQGVQGLALNIQPREARGIAAPPYKFVIQEAVGRVEGEDGILYVRIEDEKDNQKPRDIGDPVMLIEGYDPIPFTRALGRQEPDQVGSYYYYFRSQENKQKLKAEEGQKILDRTVALQSIDIFQRQDALSSVLLKRNEELIENQPSAEEFIYTTGTVEFPNAYHPTIDYSGVIEISDLSTSHRRNFADHLNTFWNQLLENNSQPTLTIQVTCTYNHKINPALDAVKLPIFLQPPLNINVGSSATDGVPTLSLMIEDWRKAINIWYNQNQPKGTEGTIGFDLIVMSNLTARPMPLLRLRKLNLYGNNILDLGEQ